MHTATPQAPGPTVQTAAGPAAFDTAVESLAVVILGAGMSGLCTAVALKRAGRHDFLIVEKSAGLGGTWWDNRYPGAAVDVPAPLYSLSFAPHAGWRRRFAAAAEIAAYMQQLAEHEGLLPHLRLNTELLSAQFDEADGRWVLRLHDGRGDGRHATSELRPQFFVCSTGPLSRPAWPALPGLETFAGPRLHTARWDAAVPLQGRRVAVIGTGSTAAQLVPALLKLIGPHGQLSVFQRTANWVLPRIDRRYGALDHRLARLPLYNRLVRRFWFSLLEWGRRGFDEGTLARRAMQRTAAEHLRRQVPDAALRAALTPRHPLGCKRLIYANDYLSAFMQPNVQLVTQAIAQVAAQSITTADGTEHAADVLVCATGFDVQHSLGALTITGLHGRTLEAAWTDGPQAHLGLTVAGFPNLFLMLGPNTATGHTSALLFIEPGVRFVLRAIDQVQRRGKRWLDVRPAVMAAYNDGLQQRLRGSVWSQCRSWYRADSGRVIALFPGFTREYVAAVDGQRWSDFDFR